MSSISATDRPPVAPAPVRRFQFSAWPLWATLAGVAGTIAVVVTDLRPAAELEAFLEGREYEVTPADMAGLDPTLGRIGFLFGILAVAALLIFAAAWRTRVESRLPQSVAAGVVSFGVAATAAGLILGAGWRGALANYLGAESGLYGQDGLFVYYMLTDFGAYLPWYGVLVAAFGVVWLAFVERTVSRALGGVTAVIAVGALAQVVITGVPGLPGVYAPMWLVVLGIWLAVGRSRVTAAEGEL